MKTFDSINTVKKIGNGWKLSDFVNFHPFVTCIETMQVRENEDES